uniref:Uncharacterized protein n=1 Tax=Helianthus annuus TaxID=4232 RepID=A0A251ST82_HELAN
MPYRSLNAWSLHEEGVVVVCGLLCSFSMIGGSILVTSRLQAVVLRMVDFGGVTYKLLSLPHNKVSVI